jgi:hypothetical protein
LIGLICGANNEYLLWKNLPDGLENGYTKPLWATDLLTTASLIVKNVHFFPPKPAFKV